jgi:hypothetical protein
MPTREEMKARRAMNRAFRPYGIALATFAFNWNRLHEQLSLLFITVLRIPDETEPRGQMNRTIPLAIWHSTDSDSAQRKILRASVECASHLTTKQRDDIIWVLNQIDKPLRYERNSALHAPMSMALALNDPAGSNVFSVIADVFSASPHSRNLSKKQNLVEELELYGEHAAVLERFTTEMYGHLLWRDARPGTHPWPGKPALPLAHRKKSRKVSPRKKTAK